MINELNFKGVSYLNMREEQSEECQRGGVHDVDEGVLGQHAGAVRVMRRGPGRRRVQVEVGAAEAMRVVTVTPACRNKSEKVFSSFRIVNNLRSISVPYVAALSRSQVLLHL